MGRKLTKEQCEKIKGFVTSNIWDGWATDYLGEPAHDFGVSVGTIRNVVYHLGAYANLPGHPLCRRRGCGWIVESPGSIECEQHIQLAVRTTQWP